MKKKSNVVLKFTDFRKHGKICLEFLTLILLLNLTVCLGILFFQIKNSSKITANQIFQNNINSIVEVKAYTEEIGESFGTAELMDNEGSLHSKLTGLYNSTNKAITGSSKMTVRSWLSTKSFDFQYQFGIEKLMEFAKQLGVKVLLP